MCDHCTLDTVHETLHADMRDTGLDLLKTFVEAEKLKRQAKEEDLPIKADLADMYYKQAQSIANELVEIHKKYYPECHAATDELAQKAVDVFDKIVEKAKAKADLN